ncbi:MAG: DUF3923 family protein [Clostridia bacterium]
MGFIKKTIMAFVLSIFLGMSVFLFFRKFDGSGAENTAEVKLISLAIWLGFYLFILAIEFVVRFLTRIGKK